MEYKNELVTKILAKSDYVGALHQLIVKFRENQISTVEIQFGSAWGNKYKKWTPFTVNIDSVQDEITFAESLNVGRFGDDDFFIICRSMSVEVLFCHEMDIHIRFNDRNDLISSLINLWKDNKTTTNIKEDT